MKLTSNRQSFLMRRIGLGIFFLAFGLLKLLKGQWFIDGPYQGFYGIGFPLFIISLVGILQVVMAASFFTNIHAKASAWIATVMMGSTIIATLPKILALFELPPAAPPPGFLFFAAVPLFFMTLSEAMKKETEEKAAPVVHHESARAEPPKSEEAAPKTEHTAPKSEEAAPKTEHTAPKSEEL